VQLVALCTELKFLAVTAMYRASRHQGYQGTYRSTAVNCNMRRGWRASNARQLQSVLQRQLSGHAAWTDINNWNGGKPLTKGVERVGTVSHDGSRPNTGMNELCNMLLVAHLPWLGHYIYVDWTLQPIRRKQRKHAIIYNKRTAWLTKVYTQWCHPNMSPR